MKPVCSIIVIALFSCHINSAMALTSAADTITHDTYRRLGAAEGYVELSRMDGRFGLEVRRNYLRTYYKELVDKLFGSVAFELEELETSLCLSKTDAYSAVSLVMEYDGPGYDAERVCVRSVRTTNYADRVKAVKKCGLDRPNRLCQ